MKKFMKVSALATAAILLMAGCTPNGESTKEAVLEDGPNVLRVLAGSEVKDMSPIIADLEASTGVQMKFDYAGTLEGTQNLAKGDLAGKYDATWFPSNRYLALLDGGPESISKEEKIMQSPVVLGVKPDVASSLGWDSANPTWEQIVDAVNSGKLEYGMTSPVSSNSGFSTLISAATALSGTGDALTLENVENVSPKLKEFFDGQTLTSGSSGWLAEKFVKSPEQDAIFNYESTLKSLTIDGKPLTIITPSDGIVTADYPLSLVSSAGSEKQELYKKATDYLLSDEVQDKINQVTLRGTRTSAQANSAPAAFELPFPNKIDTVQALITAYLEDIKKPSNIVFDIDTSGSMEGDRIIKLRDALSSMTNTAGGYNSFISFQPRESISYVEFGDTVKNNQTFDITESNRESSLQEIQAYIDSLTPVGGTAIYDSLEVSYQNALAKKKENPDSFTSIVLFTDGENMNGMSHEDFKGVYESLKNDNPEIASIPVYTVKFGEANSAQMQELSTMTGGRVFDATNSNLTEIFKEIRGYQ